MPETATRLVSLHDVDARPIRKGRLGKPVEFGYQPQIVDNPTESSSTTPRDRKPVRSNAIGSGDRTITHRTGRSPRAVTADRGYGYASVERDLHSLGVRTWRFHAQANPAPRASSLNIGTPSATRSNGEPDPKDGSTT